MGERKSVWSMPPAPLDHEQTLKVLEQHNEEARRALAARPDAAPEALFYLAANGSAETRRAVAANPGTPAQANRHLADDKDDDVRVQLARKIGQLLPNLPEDASQRMRDLTIETLERLARDAMPRVRQALAEEIKSLDCVPHRIVKAMARDVEAVAAPILEYSPLLSDADLIEIISSAQASFALLAIARRRPLRASVSEAIATAMDVPAVAELLVNSTAQIRNQTLEKIVRHATTVKEWHLPLVLRSDLSQRAVRRLASFVSKSLIETLAAKHGLDEKTRRHLKDQMKKRVDEGVEDPAATAVKPPDLAALHKKGRLDDSFVESAAESGSRQTVLQALALLARVSPDLAAKIFDSRSTKPIISLVWRAGLGMRTAFKIQTLLLKLPAHQLLPARDGVRFPMSEDEMRWHLDYFGIKS